VRRGQNNNDAFLSFLGSIINQAAINAREVQPQSRRTQEPLIFQEARKLEQNSPQRLRDVVDKQLEQILGPVGYTRGAQPRTRYVIVGGVSIYEKDHDRYKANFIDASIKRVANLRERFPDDRIVVLYYGRPGKVRDANDSEGHLMPPVHLGREVWRQY